MLSVYVVCWIFLQTFQTNFCIQTNKADPDQTAPREAVWSGSTLFAKKRLLKSQADDKEMTIVVIGSLRVKNSFGYHGNALLSTHKISATMSENVLSDTRA